MASKRKAEGRRRLAEAGIEPRLLSLEQAAAYLGVSPATFLADVEAGRMPQALTVGRVAKRWDKIAIDAMLDGAAGSPARDAVMDLIEGR